MSAFYDVTIKCGKCKGETGGRMQVPPGVHRWNCDICGEDTLHTVRRAAQRDPLPSRDERITRPILRYHGGKWLLAPWILSHFPLHKIYVEPFGGAGSVLLRKPRAFCEVYNDLDEEVVNLFRVLRLPDQARRLCDLLELTPFGRIDFKEAYLETVDPVERARRMVARSFMGFGSASSNRHYSTGFRAASKQTGRPHALDWINIPESLWLVTERLKGVVVECRDGLEVIQQQDHPETLFYLDPPYIQSSRPTSNCKQYRFEFTNSDHFHLAKVLKAIKGKAVLSGYPSELYDRELYADWHRVERTAQASGQHGRIQRTEVLWMNFIPTFPLANTPGEIKETKT